MSNTIALHRVLKAPVKRVFCAFLNPDALSSWIPPFGFIAMVHELSAVEGEPSVIPLEMSYLGWQESFIKLAQLVEPKINQ